MGKGVGWPQGNVSFVQRQGYPLGDGSFNLET